MATRPLRERVRDIGARLAAAGVPAGEARLDAELLLREALGGWDRPRLLAHDDHLISAGELERLETLTVRRAAREPMAHILGRTEFWGLEFEVTPDVLIPRPETELLVETARRLLPAAQRQPAPGEHLQQVVDVGTGSGCIAIALARELPGARVSATDTSGAALAVARRNALRHGVDLRVAFLEAAFCGDAHDCDLIVSNPPYVPERDRGSLQPEVRDHEPAAALFAGEDGLTVIRQLIERAWSAFGADGGWLVFEFGFGQAGAVRALLDASPRRARDPRGSWTDIAIVDDLQGIPRVAVARKLSPA
jgi:release factor glutamine methyltransferase